MIEARITRDSDGSYCGEMRDTNVYSGQWCRVTAYHSFKFVTKWKLMKYIRNKTREGVVEQWIVKEDKEEISE